MVYGNQQWADLRRCDWGELSFLYHSVALVKRRENEAAEEARARAEGDGRSGVTQG
jgi:hypothetical protein